MHEFHSLNKKNIAIFTQSSNLVFKKIDCKPIDFAIQNLTKFSNIYDGLKMWLPIIEKVL